MSKNQKSESLDSLSETLLVNEIYLSLQGESSFAGLPCIFVRLTACNLRCSYCDTAYAFTEGKRLSLTEAAKQVRRLAEPFQDRPGVRLAGGLEKASSEHGISKLAGEDAAAPSGGESGSLDARAVKSAVVGWLPLVELTGGEPLLQKNCLPFTKSLCDDGFTVLLETSGAQDISTVDPRVRRIMDLKCPSSGEAGRNRWENLRHLKSTDEIKFVIGTHEDYDWARRKIAEHQLDSVCPLLFSWVHPLGPSQQDKSLKAVPAGQRPISQRELAERIIADALPVRFQVQLHKIIWPADQRGV